MILGRTASSRLGTGCGRSAVHISNRPGRKQNELAGAPWSRCAACPTNVTKQPPDQVRHALNLQRSRRGWSPETRPRCRSPRAPNKRSPNTTQVLRLRTTYWFKLVLYLHSTEQAPGVRLQVLTSAGRAKIDVGVLRPTSPGPGAPLWYSISPSLFDLARNPTRRGRHGHVGGSKQS